MTLIHTQDCNSINRELIEKIGKRILLLRKSKGLSREDLAFEIGISPQQLFKYEIGENRITVDRLIMIAEVLNLKIISFFPVDDVGKKVGLSILKNEKDYRLLECFAQLQKFSGEELVSKLIELITR